MSAEIGDDAVPVDPSEPPLPAAPRTCFEITLNQMRTDYTRLPDGGMALHLTPIVQDQSGNVMIVAPQVIVRFAAAGWERFKAEIAADGRREESRIATPPPPRVILPR